MKRLMLGLVLLFSSSCTIMFDGGRANIIPLPQDGDRVGDRPNTADNALANADFTPPWNSIRLPYGNAEVVAADEHHIELSYKNNKLEGTATSFDSYMRVGGWTREKHTQTDNTRVYTYYNEGEKAGFIVTWNEPDDLKVVVELMDGLEHSKVRDAFGDDYDDGHGGGH